MANPKFQDFGALGRQSKRPGKAPTSTSQGMRITDDTVGGMVSFLKWFQCHQTRSDRGMAPEKNVERSNWHDERLDLRLGGEWPRCAGAAGLFVEWKDYPDRVRITKVCPTLPQVFPCHVHARELRPA